MTTHKVMPPFAAAYAVALAVFLFTPFSVAACVGDCDGDGAITVAELVRGVRIALNHALPEQCIAIDDDHDTVVSIGELISAVRGALDACRAPTVTPTPTATPVSAPCEPTRIGEVGNARGPAIAVAADGRFATTWTEIDPVDPFGIKNTLRLQRFASDGTPTRMVQDVAEYSAGAALAYTNRTLLLVVGEEGLSSTDGSVAGSRLVAYWRAPDDGEPRSPVTLINPSEPRRFFRGVDVAADTRGRFVVGLSYIDYPPPHRSSAYLFDPKGLLLEEFPVDSRCVGPPAVAMAASGRSIVACNAFLASDGDGVFGVLAQRFDADGAQLGNPIEAFHRPDYSTRPFDVAMDADGNFAFVWDETSVGALGYEMFIRVRHFSANGMTRADWSSQVQSAALSPQLAMSADGSAVAILGRPLRAWRFDSAARLARGPLALFPDFPAVRSAGVSIDADGDAVVVFDAEDGNSYVLRVPSGARCGSSRAGS